MKKLLLPAALCLSVGMLSTTHVVRAQQQQKPLDPNKPDEELTQKEGDERIKTLRDAVKALEEQLKVIGSKPDSLRTKLSSLQQQITESDSTLYATLNVTKADVEKFRERIGSLAARVREMKLLSDDQLADQQDKVKALENELNEQLRKDKVALLPEFYSRVMEIAKEIKSLYREKKTKTYTVGTWSENRECLWVIAGREEIYNDPFLWPKIWVANKATIRNPDIIFPGQQLTIPPKTEKTDDELKAERRYWRQKRAAAAAATNDKPEAAPQQQPIKTGVNN